MDELTPYPMAALARRVCREWRQRRAIFDLPERLFFLGDPDHDLSVRSSGRVAASPYGPAAGPHTQMAQNIVLAWLGGARIIELKTVQVLDELQIPRPSMDMQTVGYNVEWSQELKLEQSLEEYVKAAMLIEILTAGGELPLVPGFAATIFDISVGYDLAGIRNARVGAFIRGMLDARTTIERLRAELPAELGRLRDLDFRPRIADTVTLSTFHGCPPAEIEQIVDYLQEEFGLHCIVKLNPTLLGPTEVNRLLHEVLGYHEIQVPATAFANDLSWKQAVGIIGRLRERAAARGLGFGVKLTNTLLVQNHRSCFPEHVEEIYLSGAPLHVLALHLVQRCRRQFGAELPLSFSAGIRRASFPDAVALGLVPVTVCTDLLQTGGYGRARGYFTELTRRLVAVGAATIGDFVIRAYGHGAAALEQLGLADDDPRARGCHAALAAGGDLRAATGDDDDLHARWSNAAALLNTATYVPAATADPRYAEAKNSRPPRKLGSRLKLFDCVSCDKCVPVCPNNAIFTYTMPPREIPLVRLRRRETGWERHQAGVMQITGAHQIGIIPDFCNACGNCDVFCPEDGGPHLMKPRIFLTREAWRRARPLDGFHFQATATGYDACGRFGGRDFRVENRDRQVSYSGRGFGVQFDAADPEGTLTGDATAEVDLACFAIIDSLFQALFDSAAVNAVNCL